MVDSQEITQSLPPCDVSRDSQNENVLKRDYASILRVQKYEKYNLRNFSGTNITPVVAKNTPGIVKPFRF